MLKIRLKIRHRVRFRNRLSKRLRIHAYGELGFESGLESR
jgi:hypothetical protein